LELIFEGLGSNKSIKEILFNVSVHIEGHSLNLKDVESLRFIEKNSTLKIVNFSDITFSEKESNILNDTLCKNKSITALNFSHSSFLGPYEFLQNKNLKSFEFHNIWGIKGINIQDFLENLKLSNSLMNLKLNFSKYLSPNKENVKIHELINILSELQSIEEIHLNSCQKVKEDFPFQILLMNPKLKILELENSLSTDSIEPFFKELNSNKSLKSLNLENNRLGYSPVQWNEIQLTNKSIEIFNLGSKNKITQRTKKIIGISQTI
jgi:hypothetical protein